MAKVSIMDKVYDRYEDYDFTPYTDNLNPVREVNIADSKITIDDTAIYNRIKDRVEQLKQQVMPILEEIEPEEVIETIFGGEGAGRKGLPQNLVDAMNNAGGPRGPGLLGLFGPNGNGPFIMDPLELEINLLIAMLPQIPNNASGSSPNQSNSFGDLQWPPESLFTVNCDGVEETNEVSVDGAGNSNGANGQDGSSGNGSGDGSSGGSSSGSGNGANGQDGSSGNGSGDGSSGGSSSGSGNGAGEAEDLDAYLQGLLDDLIDQDNEDDQEDKNDLADCAAKELGILKIILMLLKIVASLRKIIAFVLGIIIPIFDCIQLAAGAWINPTNIGKIAQRLAQRIMALIISLLGEVLQKLWNSLNLDCLVEQIDQILDEIRNAMSGVMNLFGEINQLALDFSPDKLKEMFVDPFLAVKDTVKQLMDPNTHKAALDAWIGNARDAGKKLLTQYTSPGTYMNAAQQAMPPGAMKAVSAAKKTMATAKEAAALVTKMARKGVGFTSAALGKLEGLEIEN